MVCDNNFLINYHSHFPIYRQTASSNINCCQISLLEKKFLYPRKCSSSFTKVPWAWTWHSTPRLRRIFILLRPLLILSIISRIICHVESFQFRKITPTQRHWEFIRTICEFFYRTRAIHAFSLSRFCSHEFNTVPE